MADDLGGVLEADLDAMKRVATEIRVFLARHGVGSRCAYGIELAFEELVTNVIKYGYGDDGGRIDWAVRLDAARVTLELEDEAPPFDPVTAPLPEPARRIEEAAIGGLGLHALRRSAERFAYRRDGRRNRVVVSFRRT